MSEHVWPKDGSCFWGPWQTKTGLPNSTQYRYCIHPQCKNMQTRDTPKA